MLKLMYITKDPRVARIAVDAGVDRIFIDMEVLGKAERQGHLDSVKSHHVPEDIQRVREAIGDRAEILARINPRNPNTQAEVDAAVGNGADIVMLPMWKTAQDVQFFLDCVGGRAKTMPLLETREAAAALPDVLKHGGVDEWFIGLNDLHLSYGRRFMFELLADGTVDRLCAQMCGSGVPYGFGGVARPGSGMLPAEYILGEHYRLGSQSVILSRSFCDTAKMTDYDEIEATFRAGLADIRQVEAGFAGWPEEQYAENHRKVGECVQRILAAKGVL